MAVVVIVVYVNIIVVRTSSPPVGVDPVAGAVTVVVVNVVPDATVFPTTLVVSKSTAVSWRVCHRSD